MNSQELTDNKTQEAPADLSAGVIPELEVLHKLRSLTLDEASIAERDAEVANGN